MGKRVADVLIEAYSENTRVLVDELRAYALPNGET
jgi:hypothetical protein